MTSRCCCWTSRWRTSTRSPVARPVELIDELHRDHGRTVLIVEHRLEDVLHRDVDRIVLMAEGRIVADAAPETILASGLLEQHGIRPPLHIAALRYAGREPRPAAQRPSRSSDIALTQEQIAAVRDWVAHGRVRGQCASSADQRLPGSCPGTAGRALRAARRPRTRTTVVLDGITAQIQRGEMLGVLGSNGAGKSTLARV